MTHEDWAVERARHYIEVRQARPRFSVGWALLINAIISILMWVALTKVGTWLLS